MPLGTLADQLERILEQPVVNRTGIEGRSQWSLGFEPGDHAGLPGKVARELGITVRREMRPLDHLIIKPRAVE